MVNKDHKLFPLLIFAALFAIFILVFIFFPPSGIAQAIFSPSPSGAQLNQSQDLNATQAGGQAIKVNSTPEKVGGISVTAGAISRAGSLQKG